MTDKTSEREFPYGWELAFGWCPPEETPANDTATVEPALNASTNEDNDQAEVTRRYDRMAWLYNVYDAPMEWLGTRRRREQLMSQVEGDMLEVGVGTGKNLPFYPPGQQLTAIDISEQMLTRARARADRLGLTVSLQVADVTDLPFADDRFDTAVATSVFCSVGDPITGLAELGRVTRPEGKILLLEHVRPRNPLLGWLADLATVFTRRLFGFRVNRRTEANVEAAGLTIIRVRREGVWRVIEARPGSAPRRRAERDDRRE